MQSCHLYLAQILICSVVAGVREAAVMIFLGEKHPRLAQELINRRFLVKRISKGYTQAAEGMYFTCDR